MSHIKILRLSRRMTDFVRVSPHGIKNMSDEEKIESPY